MTFDRPDLLVLAPVAALLLAAAVWLQWRRGVRLVAAYGGRGPARRLLGRDLTPFPLARMGALVLAAAGLSFAAAGPSPEEAPPPPPPVPVDLLVAVDVSHSMTAADVGAPRIERARTLVERLVEEGVADRIALSIFADWPYGLVPVTIDPDIVTFFAPWIAPELVGTRDQGTSIPLALGQLHATWERRPNEGARRIVLLVTDGEAHDGAAEAMDSVAAVADEGFEIWTAGVGTPGGAPLFLPGSEGAPLLYDGVPVVASADPGFLRDLAARGRGEFHDISSEDGIDGLLGALARGSTAPPATEEGSDPLGWIALAALLLLTLEALLDGGLLERRRRSGSSGASEARATAATTSARGASARGASTASGRRDAGRAA